MVNIGENILESPETKFMNLPPYVFDVDHVAKIRSEPSINVLEKKNEQNSRLKKVTLLILAFDCIRNDFIFENDISG